jgi:hypothetical protein
MTANAGKIKGFEVPNMSSTSAKGTVVITGASGGIGAV